MLFIPSLLFSILTFPGVIVHEVAHRFFADRAKIPVYEVSYFRIGNPAGYVIHGSAKGLKDSFLISVGPLIINTILCALITFSAAVPFWILEATENSWLFLFIIWIGLSIGMHAFPSNEDMENLVTEVKNTKQGGPLLWATKAFAWLLRLANAFRILWFDAIYAFLVAMILPWIFGLL